MNTFRFAVALMALSSTLAAAPALAVNPNVQATATVSIKKPLVMTRVSDLNFGSILLSGSGTFSGTVSVSQAGVLTCPAANFTCSGTTSPAVYNVSGNKSQVVSITTPSTLVLTGANGTLTMAVSAPTSVTLTNSGVPGTDFGVGGSLTLSNTTVDGTYSGTFNVTADYQ